jgi:hypothetical protein
MLGKREIFRSIARPFKHIRNFWGQPQLKQVLKGQAEIQLKNGGQPEKT